MNKVKEETIKIINSLPDDCTYSDIMAEIYFKKKVEKGLKDIEDSQLVSHTKLKQKMEKWKKSIGR